MAEQVTVSKGGDVRVIPGELSKQYESRGWAVGAGPAAPSPPEQPDPRPAKAAKVEDWRAYAINVLGLPSHEVGSLTKDELIEKVG